MMKTFTLLILTLCGFTYCQGQWFVGGIHFSGNKAISRNELLAVMQLKPPEFFSRHPFSLSNLVDDISAIQRLYSRYGFLSAKIHPKELFRDSANNEVWLTIEISEGVRAVIDSISFENGSVLSDSLLLIYLPVKKNAPFDSLLFEQSDNVIRDSLGSKGFLFAEVLKEIHFNSQGDSTYITYIIEPGPVTKPGDLEINGADNLLKIVLERELAFYGKTVLTSGDLSRSVSNLYSTDLFNFVTIDPLDTSIDLSNFDTLITPVTVQVQLADMFTIHSGGGYSTDDGLYGSIESSYKNLFNAAHRLTGSAHLSTILRGAQIIYSFPWFLNMPLSADFRIYIERREEIEFSGLFRGASVSFRDLLKRQSSYNAWLRFENTAWINNPSLAKNLNYDLLRNLVLIGIGFTRNIRNSAGTGYFINIEPELAGPGIYWSDKYFKIKGNVRINYSMISRQLLFHSALIGGYITTYGSTREVPAQELFIPGDDGFPSIRGYNDTGVTMEDDKGNPEGGRIAIVTTPLEMIFPIYRLLKGVVFTDGGFFWPTQQSFSLDNIKWSIGVGIRVTSPVGIVRMDYGIPLDHNLDLNGRIHFGLGAEF
jgi:outer membrane protein insertion porin family